MSSLSQTPEQSSGTGHGIWRLSALGKHLLWIVLIKVAVLYGLWLVFIAPHRVRVDVPQMQQRLIDKATVIHQESLS